MKIMKFGGSSLADGERIKKVAEIVENEIVNTTVIVVLSAMKGITDLLIMTSKLAENGDNQYKRNVEQVRLKHLDVISMLFPEARRDSIVSEVDDLLRELRDVLHGVELIRECSQRSLDFILSFGERLNCLVFSEYMNIRGVGTSVVDARELIVTDADYGNAAVDFQCSYNKIERVLSGYEGLAVVPGFIAATPEGITTTLGRNGSDYTASIIGAGLYVEVVEIWTDVDGVMSADPTVVKDAFVVSEVSFEEAAELSYFGAKVIHPYTMIPALERNIPIKIKNTLRTHVAGTLISKNIKKHSGAITGIASIEDTALINIEGGGMVGSPGVASSIFSALAEAKVNIIMISQASSEHSICVVCRKEQALLALEKLKGALAEELRNRKIQQFQLIEDLEVVAVIGENMRGTPGISGKLFKAIGNHGISVLAIAQGSSERNISFVVEGKDKEKVLNAVHNAFFGN